jgi:hypothetical protein
MVIAFDVILIWALTVHGAEIAPANPGETRPMWSSPSGPS